MSTREERAIKKYYDHVNNSGMHCNRFPGWGEMSDAEREKWRDPEESPNPIFSLREDQTYDLYLLSQTWRMQDTCLQYKEDGPNGPGLYFWKKYEPGSITIVAGPECKV